MDSGRRRTVFHGRVLSIVITLIEMQHNTHLSTLPVFHIDSTAFRLCRSSFRP